MHDILMSCNKYLPQTCQAIALIKSFVRRQKETAKHQEAPSLWLIPLSSDWFLMRTCPVFWSVRGRYTEKLSLKMPRKKQRTKNERRQSKERAHANDTTRILWCNQEMIDHSHSCFLLLGVFLSTNLFITNVYTLLYLSVCFVGQISLVVLCFLHHPPVCGLGLLRVCCWQLDNHGKSKAMEIVVLMILVNCRMDLD